MQPIGRSACEVFPGLAMNFPPTLFLVLMLAGCASTPTETPPDGGLIARDPPSAVEGSEDDSNTPPTAIHMEVPVDGSVTDAYAAESPHPDLARAAVSAIMKSEFQPALVDGIPTEAHMSVPVRFDLD